MRSTIDNRILTSVYLLSLASFSLAVLSKEPALTLPVILFTYDFTLRKESARLPDSLKRYVPYLIVAGAYLIVRVYVLGDFAPHKRHSDLNTYQYFINVFPLFIQYLQKLVLPVNLNAFHVFQPLRSLWEAKGIISLLLTAACGAAAYLSLKKSKAAFFGLVFIIVPLLPALYIPALGENTFAERYLYLPSVGFVMLVSLFVASFRAKKPEMTKVLATALVALLLAYSIGVIKRNTVWKDNYSLWEDTVKKSPNDAIPQGNFGDALLNDKGRTDEAIERLQIALQLNPRYAAVHNNLGLAYSLKGREDEAIEQFQSALRIKPNFAEAHRNLGIVYGSKGWFDNAIEHFETATRLKPEDTKAHSYLGNAYAKKGLTDKAIAEFRTALKLKPDDAETRFVLGMAYSDTGWLDEAIEQYQIAIKLRPDYADAHNNLGIAYGQKGLIDKAIGQFQEALRLNPGDSNYHSNLANAYAIRGRYDKAEEQRRAARSVEHR
jgi:tetratricopeptide (TPR) repeat protein